MKVFIYLHSAASLLYRENPITVVANQLLLIGPPRGGHMNQCRPTSRHDDVRSWYPVMTAMAPCRCQQQVEPDMKPKVLLLVMLSVLSLSACDPYHHDHRHPHDWHQHDGPDRGPGPRPGGPGGPPPGGPRGY